MQSFNDCSGFCVNLHCGVEQSLPTMEVLLYGKKKEEMEQSARIRGLLLMLSACNSSRIFARHLFFSDCDSFFVTI